MPAARRERLIVFTRFPEPGKTKTRLIPALGAAGAARLQRQMTEHIMAAISDLSHRPGLTVEVRHEGAQADLMRAWLGSHLVYRPQGPGSLGRRMARAFDAAFQSAAEAAIIIGSDIPGLSAAIIEQAFEALQENDLALGPAQDGGYYLIGMPRTIALETYHRLFEKISWGTGEVLAQTVQKARELGLGFVMLESLADVDRPADLGIWHERQKAAIHHGRRPQISIIIPALNEAATIERTLGCLAGVDQLEVIVVDGGSTDETADLASARGARVISSTPGKSIQMNTGAAVATGEVLVFLHADTILPPHFNQSIRCALNQKGVAAGAFCLRIDSNAAGIRLIERVVDLRSRYLQLPYGDQALFMRKDLFTEVGGYPDMPIMEDFVLVRRLRGKGKIVILPAAVTTSPRRWLQFGILRTWLINQMIVIAFFLGCSPERLARWYRPETGKSDHKILI